MVSDQKKVSSARCIPQDVYAHTIILGRPPPLHMHDRPSQGFPAKAGRYAHGMSTWVWYSSKLGRLTLVRFHRVNRSCLVLLVSFFFCTFFFFCYSHIHTENVVPPTAHLCFVCIAQDKLVAAREQRIPLLSLPLFLSPPSPSSSRSLFLSLILLHPAAHPAVPSSIYTFGLPVARLLTTLFSGWNNRVFHPSSTTSRLYNGVLRSACFSAAATATAATSATAVWIWCRPALVRLSLVRSHHVDSSADKRYL